MPEIRTTVRRNAMTVAVDYLARDRRDGGLAIFAIVMSAILTYVDSRYLHAYYGMLPNREMWLAFCLSAAIGCLVVIAPALIAFRCRRSRITWAALAISTLAAFGPLLFAMPYVIFPYRWGIEDKPFTLSVA